MRAILPRRALVSVAALAAAPTGVAPTADAALLATCAEYHAARAELLAAPDDTAMDAADERQDAARERLVDLPACTPEGLVAKARVIAVDLPPAARDFDLSPENDEIRLVLSLVRDIVRLLPQAGA
ncbi:hypothetical protein M0638_27840 [Roseomonas sp. NAR14]|uniref:Secreted protein n=1 Tax=Roseomonas acroporae TaxID=2937791 RepID=A0A9X1YFH2_9PROT|nr:hypothetical protein [Roseomonas acroporae]MCK8788165.1 hypothetical protein [Roseomonas acroporae]